MTAPDVDFARLLERTRFPRWLIVALVLFAVLVVTAVTVAFVILVDQNRQRDAESAERRVAFCRSLDDVGEISLASGEGAIKTFLDPSLRPPDSPPPDPAFVENFVQLYRVNTAAEVAAAVASVRAANGFSADCRP